MQDEIEEILCLVAKPLKSRNKLLTGEAKLVLNSSLLYKINKVLDVIVSDSVDIILTERQRRELQLLLNVFNNISKLTVTQRSAEAFENVINVSKFKRLRHLELTKICLDLVTGLETLKTQLETFICNRCTKYNGILCKQKELEWPELKVLDLRHMKLDFTTPSFFISKPWIQVLDLSFNRLTKVDGLEYLEHLTFANFSFNHLKTIPDFSEDAQRKIEVLILHNNYISSLKGVRCLRALRFLDVNFNFISNKSEFFHLCHLKALCSLNIVDNPISSIKYSDVYLASCLATEIDAELFILNKRNLTSLEKKLIGKKFGTCNHWQLSKINEEPSTSKGLTYEDAPPEPMSKYCRPGKRLRNVRNVEIEEASSDGKLKEAPLKSLKEDEKFVISTVFSAPLPQETSPDKENELMKQLDLETKPGSVEEKSETILPKESHSENIVTTYSTDQNSSDIEATTILICATVHASDSSSVDIQHSGNNAEANVSSGLIKSIEDSKENKLYVENTSESVKAGYILSPTDEGTVSESNSNIEKNAVKNEKTNEDAFVEENHALTNTESNSSIDELGGNVSRESQTDESGNELSDIEEDEVFWQVQSLDKENGKLKNIILVLLNNELKERSTENGRTINRWPLNKILSCSKTKIDPVTIEIEFDTPKKDKQFRTYIMEFPDAQVLLKKVYSVLEARALSSMNQKTYECIKCGSFFVRSAPSLFKIRDLISCTVCSSTLVIEVEEPKPPQLQPPSLLPISHSSSQSSIGKTIYFGEETAWNKMDSSRSAGSLDQNSVIERRMSNATQRYESDIEVISNPSQSSIEVLGEHSRSVTPRRKISFEEKGIVIQNYSQLSTVHEIHPPFTNLTESSSSGSLTESVLTAYEGFPNNNNQKILITEAILAEEESSPVAEQEPLPASIEEEKPTSFWRKEVDVYSYTNFIDIDSRLTLFLYQQVFKDDNEALLLFVKCHLWKTGGSDYDGCAVFSTSKVYFLSHGKTDFREDICDWLTLFDSFHLKDIKEIVPLMWQQGARVQFKHISYLILLMDKERTSNFFKHMIGFLSGVKIQKNVNSNTELSLQQAVLESSVETSLDPSVISFTLTLSITILKDDVENDIFRLGGLTLTSSAFYLLAGDLTWFSNAGVPSVVSVQQMSNLIGVEKGKEAVILHFLDEKEAVEEVWRLKLVSEGHVTFVVDSIRVPWEKMFSETLDVTLRP